MLKKTCLIFIFWIAFPVLLTAQTQNEKKEEKSKKEAISILGDVIPKADEKGYMVFAGQAKNNTKDLLHSVEIVFEVLDTKGNVLDYVTAPISGKNEGILEGEEVGFFEAKTTVHISTVGSYKYNINWKAFTASDENKPQKKTK